MLQQNSLGMHRPLRVTIIKQLQTNNTTSHYIMYVSSVTAHHCQES